MSRIDAIMASVRGDSYRPQQAGDDARLQAQASATRDPASVDAPPVSAEDLRAIAQQMKRLIESASGQRISFGIDEKDDALYLKIVDEATGEVVREMPSQEARELRDRLTTMLGMLVDKKA